MSFLSSENPKSCSKSFKFPKENDYLNEKIWSLRKSRSGYVSAMTRIINKLTEQINLNSDVKEIQRYEFKLQNAIQNIRDITAKLHEVVIDEKEQENVLNFCTEQEFRVIQICKSINNYTHQLTNVNIQKSNSGNRSRRSHTDHSVHTTRSTKHHLLPNPNPFYSAKQNFGEKSSINVRPAPTSLNSHGSSSSRLSHASSYSSNSDSSTKSSSDSHVSNPSYLAVLERRRTAEHAKISAKQAVERTQRKLKLLQKSFDYERQKIEVKWKRLKIIEQLIISKPTASKNYNLKVTPMRMNHHKSIPILIKVMHTRTSHHQ